jgi:hypothetical protein
LTDLSDSLRRSIAEHGKPAQSLTSLADRLALQPHITASMTL